MQNKKTTVHYKSTTAKLNQTQRQTIICLVTDVSLNCVYMVYPKNGSISANLN